MLNVGAALLVFNAQAALALSLEILPASPRYQESVVARLVRPPLDFGVIYGATVTMQGNTIAIVYYQYPELSTAGHDVTLGQLPAGTYDVTLRRNGSDAIESTARFTVAPSAVPSRFRGALVPSVNFSGQWWAPAESGWGLAITQGPTNVLFAEWFVHDPAGVPVWYTLHPGEWTRAETFMAYTGPIYQTLAPYWAGPYSSPMTSVLVGEGTLTFRNANSGILDFVINGVRVVKEFERLPIE